MHIETIRRRNKKIQHRLATVICRWIYDKHKDHNKLYRIPRNCRRRFSVCVHSSYNLNGVICSNITVTHNMTREHLDITIRVYDEAVTVMCAGETRSIDINNWRYCEAQMVMFSCFIKNRYNDWYNQFVRPRINRTKPYIANQN